MLSDKRGTLLVQSNKDFTSKCEIVKVTIMVTLSLHYNNVYEDVIIPLSKYFTF